MSATAVVIVCDDCGTERRVDAGTLPGARKVLHGRRWLRRSINGVWKDLCPNCAALRYGERY